MGSERGDARLPLSSLLERSEGLILLTGCRKSPITAALESSMAEAEALMKQFVQSFGPGNVFAELQDNCVKGDAARNKALARLAGRMGLGVVATGNVHYHRPERHRLQDVLVSIKNRTTLEGAHRARRANRLFHLPEPWEMRHRFENRLEALTNTLLIAERCAAFNLTEDLGSVLSNLRIAWDGWIPHGKKRVTRGSSDRNAVATYTPELTRIIGDLFEKEIEAFGYEGPSS